MTHTSEISRPTAAALARLGIIDPRTCWFNCRPMSYYYTVPLVKRKPHDA
jgi:hypothetical protein